MPSLEPSSSRPGQRSTFGPYSPGKESSRSDFSRTARGTLEVFGGAPRLLSAGVFGGTPVDEQDEPPGGILFSSVSPGKPQARTGLDVTTKTTSPVKVKDVKDVPALTQSSLKLADIEKSLSERALVVENLESMLDSTKLSRSTSQNLRSAYDPLQVLEFITPTPVLL